MVGFNPEFDWRRFGGNALADIGTSIAQGGFKRGFGLAAEEANRMQPYRQQQLEKQQAIAQSKEQLKAAADAIISFGGDQRYADAVLSGAMDPGTAWNAVLTKQDYVDPTETVEGRASLAQQYGLDDAAAQSFVLTGKLPEGVKPPTPPSGYQPTPEGNLTFIPGGPADPATAGKTTEATRRNQQLAKVIVPEVESLLGGPGRPGTFDALTSPTAQTADALGPLGVVLTGGPSAEFQQAKNSLKTIIASYLYSVSGATANPGEVETQASVLTPRMGEPQASLDEKKKRIATMVQAVIDAAKGTPIDVAAPGVAGPGTTYTYNPATGELE